MLFCQLAGAQSLREITKGLSCTVGKLKHPGMKGAPKDRLCLMQIRTGLVKYKGHVL
jgi:hypothetical protein